MASASVQLTRGSRGGWRPTLMSTSTDTHVHTEAARGTGAAGTVGRRAGCGPSALCGSLPPSAAGTGAPSLGAHNLAGPRLVGSVRGQLGEHHLHSLELLVLGRDRAHFVGHLVAFHRHVLPLDAGAGRGASAWGCLVPGQPLWSGLRAASPWASRGRGARARLVKEKSKPPLAML